MASFVDKQYQFSPYVETTPVEEMVKVGVYKQQKYDEGVQKIQGWLDETAALPVLRPADKEYLQTTVNNLNAGIKKVAGADFSNQQLISSVGGAVTSIVKDKYIRAGMAAAANYKNEMEMIEEDRKNGKLNPANEDDFLTNFNNYYTNTNLADKYGNPIQFNATYKPAVDWQEIFRKDLAAAHVDSREWETEAYTTDAKGNQVINPDILIQRIEKGLLSPKVRSIVETVFARPEVAQQLGIEGRYKFKGYTPELLIAQQEASYAEVAKRVQTAKEELAIQARVSSDQASKNAIQATALDNELKKFRENTDRGINKIKNDFDGAKVDAYVSDETAKLIMNNSWAEISAKTAKSPAAEMALSRANYDLAVKKEVFDQWAKRQDLANDEERLGIERSKALIEKMKAENKLTPEGFPTVSYSIGAVDPAEEEIKGSGTYTDKTKELEVQRQQMQAQLLSSLGLGFEDMYIEDKGVYRINWKNFNQAKYQAGLKALAQAHLNGTIQPEFKNMEDDFYNLTSVVIERNKRAKEIENNYVPVIKKFTESLKTGQFSLEDLPEEISVVTGARRGELFPFTGSSGESKTIKLKKEDIAQVYIAKQEEVFSRDSPEIVSAKNYLKAKYGLTETQLGSLLHDATSPLNSTLNRIDRTIGSDFAKQMQKREQAYKELQETTQYQHGLLNTSDTKQQSRVNSIFSRELSETLGDRTKTGNYKEVVSWLDAGADNARNLDKNDYYVFRNPSGGWELQVRRNEGGAFKFSPKLQIDEQTAMDLGAKVDLNKDAFLNTFGNFLELNRWSKTAKDFASKDAASTALLRHKVGKYSVGLHLKSFGKGTWMPFAYINDENGNPINNNVQINFSSYKNAKNLPEAERQRIANMPLLWKDADVISQFMNLPESYIDLLINK